MEIEVNFEKYLPTLFTAHQFAWVISTVKCDVGKPNITHLVHTQEIVGENPTVATKLEDE